MGMKTLLMLLFGGGRNIIRETSEVFVPNAESAAARTAAGRAAALGQFGAEFRPARGWFDILIDGLNRLPRPLLAFGTIGLFIYAMVEPMGFARRMTGLALVPEPLWWLLGAVVGFYFGARELAHSRGRGIVGAASGAVAALDAGAGRPGAGAGDPGADNPALAELHVSPR